MKKVIIFLALLALSLCAFGCGDTGSGSADSPSGENPGVPSVVQLLPSHFIAQTNTVITLHAKVLDGNGVPVQNTPVTFTNLSSPFGILSGTSANTDGLGIATVTISSTSPGFVTIVAQVNNGVSNVRDRKSVFFTTNDVMAVSMSLDVDSVPGNGIFNETSDLTLFDPPPTPDDTVLILATVFDAGGIPVAGESISWASDLTGDTVTFLAGTENITDEDGQARAVVQVTPESIRDTETHLNLMALAGNGAVNMVTLFLEPVFISSVAVSAAPQVVEVNGTSTITATVMLSTGASAPDGTAVSFTTTCGTVDPFAQTTDGVATAQFTAPATAGTCTITATVGAASGSTAVTVTAPPDTTPPVVTTTIPADAATGVVVDSTVTISWSEDIACSTVNTTNITISPSSPPTWTRTSCSGSQAVFTPTGQLASTLYTVTVGTAVTDLAGNPMASAYTFSYTTAP